MKPTIILTEYDTPYGARYLPVNQAAAEVAKAFEPGPIPPEMVDALRAIGCSVEIDAPAKVFARLKAYQRKADERPRNVLDHA